MTGREGADECEHMGDGVCGDDWEGVNSVGVTGGHACGEGVCDCEQGHAGVLGGSGSLEGDKCRVEGVCLQDVASFKSPKLGRGQVRGGLESLGFNPNNGEL